MVLLSYTDLALAAVLVIALAALSVRMKLSLWKQLIIAASRTTVQLLLIGLVLKAVFANARLPWITLIAFFMLLAAGREVTARQKRRLAGFWGFGVGTGSMFVSSFTVTIFALLAIVGNTPWYAPQYAIPLLGMLLGNTMNGVALGINYLTQAAWEQRNIIEER
ncbi:MAG TPA: ABC transporter permease, partial [Deltaproteobacteria bacterium]|nr:ABC transporter permease [Deltaproteobacteria bacterium]